MFLLFQVREPICLMSVAPASSHTSKAPSDRSVFHPKRLRTIRWNFQNHHTYKGIYQDYHDIYHDIYYGIIYHDSYDGTILWICNDHVNIWRYTVFFTKVIFPKYSCFCLYRLFTGNIQIVYPNIHWKIPLCRCLLQAERVTTSVPQLLLWANEILGILHFYISLSVGTSGRPNEGFHMKPGSSQSSPSWSTSEMHFMHTGRHISTLAQQRMCKWRV